MSYYLDRVKKLGNSLPGIPAKPAKGTFDGFAGNPGRGISGKTHSAVFEYQHADRPGCCLVMLCPPGSDLAHAQRRLAHQFGPYRVIEVRPYAERTP